jgi:hypothetical protein
VLGWQRQAESSELGDGGFPVRRTIVKGKPLAMPPTTRTTLRLPCQNDGPPPAWAHVSTTLLIAARPSGATPKNTIAERNEKRRKKGEAQRAHVLALFFVFFRFFRLYSLLSFRFFLLEKQDVTPLQCGGIERLAVSRRPVRADIEHPFPGGGDDTRRDEHGRHEAQPTAPRRMPPGHSVCSDHEMISQDNSPTSGSTTVGFGSGFGLLASVLVCA